jgi:hypothetical protein
MNAFEKRPHMNRTHIIVFFLTAMAATCFTLALADADSMDPTREARAVLRGTGLIPHVISTADFHEGIAPVDFLKRTGAPYKPAFNEEPSIPAQCWIETGYGTQNACLYCHTDFLAKIEHGNAFPLAEDQILYSFPSPDLNTVLWRNTIFPQEITARLNAEGIALPDLEDVDYVRSDNWQPAFDTARAGGTTGWLNPGSDAFVLFPALNPRHLFPYNDNDPTGGGSHGFVDADGFVRDENSEFTGWRAVNFFPYGIFTPLSGSVSGIYIRLPEGFMNDGNRFSRIVYEKNLDLLESNIKNRSYDQTHYYGDASQVPVNRGFFPQGTEFAHPLHYVDLNADGQAGNTVDGVTGNTGFAYEFPGTRSKRLKEMRYMYKYKDVGIQDISEEAHFESVVIGHEGQGWVDNNAGWLLSAYIEDRRGDLRPQTTEELMQCMGCHGKVGNTVDSVWSFQRKLPGSDGWREMDYGGFDSARPGKSRLQDYVHAGSDMGELGYFYHVVAGADLYGVMPDEIARALTAYAAPRMQTLELVHPLDAVFNDDLLKNMAAEQRRAHLLDRQKVMRQFVADLAYLEKDTDTGRSHVRGTLLYPSPGTVKNNIRLYRKIVLDQSFNLGKDVFGTEPDNVPFTFRSDGTVTDAGGRIIPAGEIITSRPYDEDGTGITPTGIVRVNDKGEPVDWDGHAVDIDIHPERAAGHISTGGTFDTLYNPILSDIPLQDPKK